jgi:hypothetical protein
MPTRQADHGAILVVVLFVTMVVLGLGMTGLFLTSGNVQMVANINLQEQARLVAEAGLEHGRAVLRDPTKNQDVHTLLSGTGNSQDEIPTSTAQCGVTRGAVLRDGIPLVSIPFPQISRTADLPASAAHNLHPRLGSYTVHVRQDLSDCRMGNFTCDVSPTSTITCSSDLPPNGTVVLLAEGVAIDGRTKVTIESGFTFAQPTGTGGSATCGSSGTGGTGTGGSTGTGGAGTGGSGTGGSGTGGSGTGGALPGTGGSSTSYPCLKYAVSAVAPCSNGWIPGCLTINQNTIVDGFDRSLGPYSSSNHTPTSAAMTCTQATNSCPNNCPTGCITAGIQYGITQNLSTSTLPVPSHTTNWNQIVVPPTTTLYPATPGVAAYYQEISVNSGVLTLRAGDYVVDSLNLNSLGTLYIDDTNGPVHLWVKSNVSPNSTVTVKSGNPANFWLIYNGTGSFNNNTSNNFTGIIFAPAADINLNYHVTGAVVGGHVTLNGNAWVHFDTQLACK